SALWAQPDRERRVTWTTATGREEFLFRGGIILIANRPLAELPELQALATRITVMELDVTNAELAALMRDLASQGYVCDGKLALEAEKCQEVCEYVIAECRAAGCQLDLRLLTNSYKDYLLWEGGDAGCAWQDLVAARIREAAHHFQQEVSRLSREER